MSLVKTLAKVAIGVAVVKGLGKLVTNSGAGGGATLPRADRTPGHGKPYEGPLTRGSAPDGNLIDVLGKVLGGTGPRGRGSLGSAMEELSRLSRPGRSSSMHRVDPNKRSRPPESGTLGDLLDQSLQNYGEPESKPTAAQEEFAELLLRALIQAAKADGRIDVAEREQLKKNLGDLDAEELEFVNAELAKPIDIAGLVRETPSGAEAQVYMMSVMGIDLDTQREAAYLQDLSRALGLRPAAVNEIHDRLGEPRVFS